MKTNRLRWMAVTGGLLGILLGSPWFARAQQQQIMRPDDFAAGIPLKTEGAGPFYEVTLSVEFYRGVTRSDLTDSAVFDADGKPVPHAVHTPARAAPVNAWEALPFFPLTARPEDGAGGLSLRFKTGDDGAILDYKSALDAHPEERIVAYVMDATSFHAPFSALELNFQSSKETEMYRVSVEGSDDLTHWSTLTHSQTVGRFSHQGQSLEKMRVAFNATRYKYLRVTWQPSEPELRLIEVKAEVSQEVKDDLHVWETISGDWRRGEDKGYHFDTGGWMPVDRMRISFPGANVAVPVKLYSRKTPQAPWQFRADGLPHRLTIEGRLHVKEEIDIPLSTDRHWKLEVNLPPEQDRLFENVMLMAGWTPHRLIFLAQGRPPYLLAFGSGRLSVSPFPLESLMKSASPKTHGKALVATAEAGAPFSLGGKQRLLPPEPPLPWKKWVLWAVLCFGVGLMTWMAVRLYRQLSREH